MYLSKIPYETNFLANFFCLRIFGIWKVTKTYKWWLVSSTQFWPGRTSAWPLDGSSWSGWLCFGSGFRIWGIGTSSIWFSFTSEFSRYGSLGMELFSFSLLLLALVRCKLEVGLLVRVWKPTSCSHWLKFLHSWIHLSSI